MDNTEQFWERYDKLDNLGRKKLLKQLNIVKDSSNLAYIKLSKSQREDITATKLLDYFEDLEDFYREKWRNKK